MTTKDDIEYLFRKHYAVMYRLAMLILRDDDVARDIVHDVFEALLISGRSDVSEVYLLAAVRNRCLKYIRSLSAQDRMKAAYFVYETEIEDEDWPDDETIVLIKSTVSHELTDACRRVVGFHEYNRTQYSGTAVSIDRIRSSRLGIGLSYNISVGNFYGMLGAGYNWDRLDFCSTVDRSSRPSFDLSLQYAIRKKHSIAVDFHYGTKHPLPSFRSANVITASPFLKYSGNPELIPLKSYDFSVDYTWVPSNNFSFSAFASGWIVGDRYVFNYEATSDGVVRTIIQPGGGYAQGRYGIKGTSRFLDRKLMATAMLAQSLNYNGSPYNINHSDIYGYAQVRYYLGNWNFALTYISAAESPDGSVNGIWNRNKSDWYIAIGWSNSKWNVNANIINFSRWNWRSSYQEMYSAYYDTHEQIYNGSSHALIQVSATYTIGFGKKVKQDNAPSVKNSSSSGILQ